MRILLVDDQAEFRSGLRDLLSTVDGIEVIAEAHNGQEAVQAVSNLRPDVTLMDLRMPVMDGIAATLAIRALVHDACILVLTTFDEDRLVREAIQAGAAGYLLKGTPLQDMLSIFDLATRGYVAIGKGVSLSSQSTVDNAAVGSEARERSLRLSEREHEIWSLIGEGLTNRDIAQNLFLTEGTVKNYVTTILGTLGVRHRTEAALIWRSIRGSNP